MSENSPMTTQDPSIQENFDASSQASSDSIQTKNEILTDDKPNQLDQLLDIEVTLSVEMGRLSMKLKELLCLSKNSIIELNKTAGEPLDINANGALIARGEVVIVNNRYGIRLTEVVSKKERMKNV